MLLAGKEIWVFNIKVCPGLEKTSLYFFVRNSATLVHELYLLLPLIPIQVNWAELQYWTQPMDRGEVFSVINSIFFFILDDLFKSSSILLVICDGYQN